MSTEANEVFVIVHTGSAGGALVLYASADRPKAIEVFDTVRLNSGERADLIPVVLDHKGNWPPMPIRTMKHVWPPPDANRGES